MLHRIGINGRGQLFRNGVRPSSSSVGNGSACQKQRLNRHHQQKLLRRSAAYCAEQHFGSFRMLGHQGRNTSFLNCTLDFPNRPMRLTVNRRHHFHSTVVRTSLPDHQVVAMPALSPTMESGSIAKWNLKEGDAFEVGTSICEVETDKAVVSFDATDDGFIAKILVTEGEIKVGQPIMVTCEEASDVSAFTDFSLDSTTTQPPAPSSMPSPAAMPASLESQPLKSIPALDAGSDDRVFASPFARKMAREAGISMTEVLMRLSSRGENVNESRIVAADVIRAASIPAVSAAVVEATSAPQQSTVPASVGDGISIPGIYADFLLSDAATSLAARQTYAKQAVPHYYLSVDLNLESLISVRQDFNSKSTDIDLSVQDFMIKAAAMAMQQVPDVNGAWMDTFVRRYNQVDINLVMGAGNYVATPVLRNVGSRGLISISKEVASFEDEIFNDDEKSPMSSKMAMGTFSIHNLGIYGVKSAAPIVLTPQACALSLGAIVDTVVPNEAAESELDWKVAPMMTVTLSCDHRVVDGAVGAQWLASLKAFVENPLSMLL